MSHRGQLLFLLALGAGMLALLGGGDPRAAGKPQTRSGDTRPLHPLTGNSRYFADRAGRPVYLTGSHVWWNLTSRPWPVDCRPVPQFRYEQHLQQLARQDHNFLRLWRLEHTRFVECGKLVRVDLQPWARTGPGRALDGRLRFDLTRLNPRYFALLRERVRLARKHGFYVAVMLFEGWGTQNYPPRWRWRTHPFRSANNVNGVEGDQNRDGLGIEINMLGNRRVVAIQERYVRQVVSTLRGFDNVLYEIANEAGHYSTPWQYHMIRYVKKLESRAARRHPVGMTFQHAGGNNSALYRSPADWVSPWGEQFLADPVPAPAGKVSVFDTDHLCGHSCLDPAFVWKAFLRGYNPIYMDTTQRDPRREAIRRALGRAAAFARRLNLARARPLPALASTGFCLAAVGRQYLVYQPGSGAFTVDLSDAPGTVETEWFNPSTGRTVAKGQASGGGTATFQPPFEGPAVLYVRRP